MSGPSLSDFVSAPNELPAFTRTLAEDLVEYRVFSDGQAAAGPLCALPDAARRQLETLRLLRGTLSAHAAALTCGHLWQRDPFALALVLPLARSTAATTEEAHLVGATGFGDALDDEWLIAGALFRLTAAAPGTAASLRDDDGDFVLVEVRSGAPRSGGGGGRGSSLCAG